MSHVGVNIGALTVKVVALRGDSPDCRVMAHQGRPLETLETLLAEPQFADAESFAVSGHLGHIPEVAAIQRALRELDGEFDAVASLGGESFLVYLLADGRITNVLSHNKCAAGSGEFFVQQIGRMGLDLEEAIERSWEGKVVPLAARCSVHCKSDITHKLNRREASPQDILHTLHDSMANKVASLLERGQRPLRRVLLIGGVSRNAAMLAALREKLASAEIVVHPESPWFEAWGSALLARDDPRHRSPKLSVPPALASLPALDRYADRVQVLAAPPCQAPGDGPLVLGVDAGSTTTKAVLLDSAHRGVVASHYARTSGDPVAATRECLRSLARDIGNRRVVLTAATGSARELVGAYLGAAHVYNEISAHAAGATHYDADVDTIFEIGGQDSKYIRLRNGVPIEYAMNDACSAGTGSFLEECARGDLGISVADIAEIALAADAPVHLKANCAAFINSDIRLAQQQGRSRADIVAGLVYAIAANYLGKVKGSRSVGGKVFLQGGVALNRAVGHAIAHGVGRPVVIPPSPELLGALGVALLAMGRCGGAPGPETDLLSLAAPEMESVGRFTCRACGLYCGIDRFEVAGRRFPFGGRCSLFEHAGRRKGRAATAPDLVEQRRELLFGNRSDGAAPDAPRIGIPRALTTHSLHPLYATFFSRLGMEVVLSGVHPQGDLKSYSGFCFPAQIAHGAVLDLAERGIDQVFLPHVSRMPRADRCRDSYLCPITQAGPYFLARAFPDIRFLSPLLDFAHGYEADEALVELAVGKLGYSRSLAREAWADAARAQTQAEQALRELGQRALDQAVACGEPAILLIGHSYNAFAAEASLSVGKKLSSMGLVAIPGDCLAPIGSGRTSWHFSNQVLNAVALARRHRNLFPLCVSNFSCTIDAFTLGMLASEMGQKPYLILEIDAHTADAGVQTRLEAFLDIIGNYRQTKARRGREREFKPCRLATGGRVVRSNGEQVPLSDPRVKLYFPNFSRYHAQALSMAARCLGLQAGEVLPLERSQLDEGLRHTSGRECLPLPVCIGQMHTVHEDRPPGEIAGFYMLRGGAPCVADAYRGYLERFIAERRLEDLFLLIPAEQNGHLGFGARTLAEHVSPAILLADLLVEIDEVLRVVGAEGSAEQLRQHWERLVASVRSLDQLHAELPAFVDRLAALPRTRDPRTCPRVVVTGDFFTRFSPFFMEGVHDLYARRGIILKPVDLSDLFQYATYHGVAGTAGGWGMKPGGLALARACTRMFQPDGREYLQRWLIYQAQRRAEDRYRRQFRKTGLLLSGPNEVASLFEKASELVSPTIFGEVIPTVGRGLQAQHEGYDGVILIGPFNCLPFRISEAILQPVSIRRGMPILAYESDGYPVPASFLRQVEVHIQQVLERAAARPRTPRTAREILSGYFASPPA
ncbi:MAG: acyl-CoA dehydratase activase [Planctomycetota bacterium]|jgi:predicted CoA-substrate-specific enzyme activase